MKNISPTQLVGLLGAIVVSTKLFTKGMFMDGTIYAAVSRNLSIGLGNFWTPYYTAGSLTQFHEHPPLFFGLESLFFFVFGDHLFVERLFDLMVYLLTLWMVVKIWNRITSSSQDAWKPLLLLIFIPDFIWVHQNNMLEALMGLFLLIGAYFCLLSIQKNQVLYTAIAGLMVCFGFFTKGFTALYLWGIFAALYLFDGKISFLKALINTLFIFIFTLVPFGLIWMIPEAKDSLSLYFEKQVIGSIENVSTVESRFYIVLKFLENLILPILILALAFIANRKTKNSPIQKNGIGFVLLAIFGVIPIMISMKQRGFYISTVYPFIALGLALLFQNQMDSLKFNFLIKYNKALQLILVSAFVLTPIIAYQFIGRDQTKYQLTYDVKNSIDPEKNINASKALMQDYGLNAYFMRLHKISLVPVHKNHLEYILTQEQEDAPNLLTGEKYFLYRK